MLQGPVVVLVAFLYLGLLFAVAYWGDKRADQGRSVIANPTIYALSIAVYCTTWTYYGSVGRAAVTGVGFLPIYLGPTLVMALGGFLILKMIRTAKANRITSIADFIASRYGKSQLLGGLVTVIAVIGIVPYIALQLKAVSGSFDLIVGYPALKPAAGGAEPVLADTTFYIALLLAAFTILFGTRHLDATERHEGMVAAVAFESVVKLLAFGAVGLFVTYGIYNGFGDIFARAMADEGLAKLTAVAAGTRGYATWFSLTFLAGLAILFLPRQFQVTVVENVSEAHLKRAIWLFPLYLFLINLFVLPIALGGLMQFPGQGIDADTFVLTLPMSAQQELLALVVFVGGLSAATGMVIVETIALSTMVCNDLVMPLLLRTRALALNAERDLSRLLLGIRRGAILVILLLGYLYFRLAGDAYALVGIGLISFSAVAQFAPAMIGGMYWRGGTRDGALAGLAAGFVVWAYTLLLPSFSKSGWLAASFVSDGPFGIELLKPHQLFGLSGLDDISHCLFWSFAANIGAYVVVSLLRAPSAAEASQATQFVDALKTTRPVGSALWRGSAEAADLISLVGRFLGPQKAEAAFAAYARRHGVANPRQLEADADLVHYAELLLAGAIGGASARVMVASVAKEEPLSLPEVMNILDEASQLRSYSRELERKSRQLEAATDELRAANDRLLEVDRLKDDFMASVSHELRTPLTSIRAFSEILRDDPKTALADREHFLGIIVSETERLTRLVNQILDMAKIESGNAEWLVEDVDLASVVEQSAAATSQLFRDKGVSLTLNLAPGLPLLRADRDRMMQVVINLLSNAVKFAPQGEGKVTVSLTADETELRVVVRDNGPGIRKEDQKVIFDRFRQGGDAMTSKPTGTGLGLPISLKIVEYFGGKLWVESEPGEGASFIFSLPRPAEEREGDI